LNPHWLNHLWQREIVESLVTDSNVATATCTSVILVFTWLIHISNAE